MTVWPSRTIHPRYTRRVAAQLRDQPGRTAQLIGSFMEETAANETSAPPST